MSKQTALQRINKLIIDNFKGYKDLLDFTLMHPDDKDAEAIRNHLNEVRMRDYAYFLCRKIVEEEIRE